MRPGGRFDSTFYRDGRPGRHATRAAALADALDEAAEDIEPAPGPPGTPEIYTRLGDEGRLGFDPYLNTCAAASAPETEN
ncbi:hypothetical protein CcI49_23055 [Frankia sp. CcI49]|uniref:hypothetical protein n=1 Tax=Frankia sp. CcI49 TaxID=1745382 RepID=UPI00097843EC|nr:hypothetical protein [Frankia sp. CcI49]ONH58337.1 hypothetical protein CcI49_23055 [Frankia sp. CcI49]